jgi:hypothetical protein
MIEHSMMLPPHDPELVVPTDGYFDPDATNGLRARSARNAMLHYRDERGFQCDETTCTVDLMTDLLHHLHAAGEEPFECLKKVAKYFHAEIGSVDGVAAVAASAV